MRDGWDKSIVRSTIPLLLAKGRRTDWRILHEINDRLDPLPVIVPAAPGVAISDPNDVQIIVAGVVAQRPTAVSSRATPAGPQELLIDCKVIYFTFADKVSFTCYLLLRNQRSVQSNLAVIVILSDRRDGR